MSACLHGEQPRDQLRLPRAGGKQGASVQSELNGLSVLADMTCVMTQAGQDMSSQLSFAAHLRKVARNRQMAVCGTVSTGIVGHPACHLGERGRSREDRSTVVSTIGVEKPSRDVGLQIADHGRVEVPTTDVPVRCAE